MELVACGVDASGALAWGASGKPVMLQPGYSAEIRGVSVDALGRAFVTALLSPVSADTPQFFTQSLTALGVRAWGTFGMALGPCGGGQSTQLLLSSGFATFHADLSGVLHLQIQDETSAPLLGDTEGQPLEWTPPWNAQLPLATEESHVILLRASGGGPD